ncbi:transcriptional regulator GcvA [Aestuariispira insulae]|uniref:LysR family transcriptional regulator n=1 Tax=Aestuariispira insulae TaxID=1461337 RepID=A0A3D9HMN4_9PROT|nr:transcriptional regulator GcvA [Aestuariispira insulae]RED50762.1 LysR family transcriptional regulator [Aestuariispira insulae]
MRRFLPSITALQFFESSARHLSFTKASEELNVTQSAVSRQVRNLEDFLGKPLFLRVKKRLVLTPSGAAYALKIKRLLDQAEEATIELMARKGGGGVLNVAVHPTFGSRWLVPRLSAFMKENSDIQVNLSTHLETIDLEQDNFDVAILYGNGDWPGTLTERLMGESIVPVCAPELLSDLPNPGAGDLMDMTLLQHTTRPSAWADWFKAAGIDQDGSLSGPRFEQIYMVIQAALAGLGVAILPSFLVQDEVASGKLVVPVDLAVPSEQAYYLIYPEQRAEEWSIQQFCNWVRQTAQT